MVQPPTISRHLHPEDIPWIERTLESGLVQKSKLLRCDPQAGEFTVMTQYPAPHLLTPHYHSGAVHAYTVEGRWRYLEYDWVATSGSYVYEQPGTVHTLSIELPTLAIFVVNGAIVNVSSEGAPTAILDAWTALDLYTKGLAAAGIELPDGIVV